MQLNEALNRGRNLLATSIVALAGIAFLPEFFIETDIDDKIDDGVLFLIGLVAIWWYNRNGNRLKQSMVPMVLVILSLVDKIAAVAIEFSDKESVGDDFGGLILFLAATLLVWWQYRRYNLWE